MNIFEIYNYLKAKYIHKRLVGQGLQPGINLSSSNRYAIIYIATYWHRLAVKLPYIREAWQAREIRVRYWTLEDDAYAEHFARGY